MAAHGGCPAVCPLSGLYLRPASSQSKGYFVKSPKFLRCPHIETQTRQVYESMNRLGNRFLLLPEKLKNETMKREP